MLAVTGGRLDDVQAVLSRFRAQSFEGGPGADGLERHPDGWGIVAAEPGRVRHLARRATDAHSDPLYPATVGAIAGLAPSAFYVAHFRQASQGRVAVENSHPFVRDGWSFCHNGTIHFSKEDPKERYDGETDSERFFLRLLRRLREERDVRVAIARTVGDIDHAGTYTSLTFLLTDGTTLYAYRRLGTDVGDCGTKECQAAYYSLGVARSGTATVVTQEPTHLGPLSDWQNVPDGGLLIWRRGEAPRIVDPQAVAPVVA